MRLGKRVILFTFLFIFVFSACKDPLVSESDLVPDNKLGVIFTDTLTLESYVEVQDSIRSDELETHLLGNMNDPIFGRSNAELYFQLRLINTNPDLGSNIQIDSAVLMLQYKGNYGNNKAPQNLVVYQVNEVMQRSTDYFSKQTFSILPNEIGRLNNFVPNFTDSIKTRFRTFPPHLRIPIDPAWASNILNQSNTANFANNETFVSNFLNGLYVKAEESGGGQGIVYIDFFNLASSLSFYFKNEEGRDTVFSLIVSSESATVNHFEHDYSGSIASQFLADNRSPDSLMFIQSMAGLKTRFTVPHLKNLGKISIAKAELVITNFKNNLDVFPHFTVPEQLTLTANNQDGIPIFIDDQFVNNTFFGGNRIIDNSSNSKNLYKFNLALYYQSIINGSQEDFGINIITFPSNTIADRLIAGGGTHNTNPLKLKLTYTKIEE